METEGEFGISGLAVINTVEVTGWDKLGHGDLGVGGDGRGGFVEDSRDGTLRGALSILGLTFGSSCERELCRTVLGVPELSPDSFLSVQLRGPAGALGASIFSPFQCLAVKLVNSDRKGKSLS